MSDKTVTLDFNHRSTSNRPSFQKQIAHARGAGGRGVFSTPEPYSGPEHFPMFDWNGQEYEISRVKHDPSGAAGGSFRVAKIDSKTRVRTELGYHYSYPTPEACYRLKLNARQ